MSSLVPFPLRSRVISLITLSFLWVATSGCSKTNTPSPSELLRTAKKELRAENYPAVDDLVAQIPSNAKEFQAGQLLLGEAAFKEGREDEAIQHYLDAANRDLSSDDGQLALFSAAELYLDRCQLTEAEPLYRRILEFRPDNAITNERMAFLLSVTGRYWESMPYYVALIKGGTANYRELAIAADVSRGIDQAEFLAKCKSRRPNDKLVRLALASQSFASREPEAKEQLEALIRGNPDLLAAHAMLGELIVEENDDARFARWHEALPESAGDSPTIWYVRGLWARQREELEIAADCWRQTALRAPFHRHAHYALGQVLAALRDPLSDEIAAHSERLIALSMSVDQVLRTEGRHEPAFQRSAELLEDLGRIWEACAWGVVARRRFPASAWPHELLRRQSHKLADDLPWVDPEKNPLSGLSTDVVPRFGRLVAKVASRYERDPLPIPTSPEKSHGIRFEEADVISFQYHNGDDPDTKGVRTFEQTGGGVAILDFDHDGAPDVFLTQGSDWKTGEEVPSPSPRFRDALFRNLSDGTFQEMGESLTGPDSGYGQGVAIGDFNNDGFPDIYVANVGRNALYENMGDGTFSNVTDTAGLEDESWTVSAMVCDLNADGLPDLFDVNYLKGDGVYTKICKGKACSPTAFDGAPDRLLINQGDGRFEELPRATPRANSKGMGIVAFELEADRRPALFIANDQVANHLLINEPADNSANLQLVDRALINGLAFNEDGVAMACMGIAADDLNGDNQIDLFVTNFHNEANTLYRQEVAGLFVDRTKLSNLHAASQRMVGWGTQALDADLDGLPDLVLANGHVDDYRDRGGEYHMRPQFFRNRGGRFEEMTADQLGPWFAKKFLGRGLARVDWDLDGRPEFIVSNINAPASVLKNTSPKTGHFLRVRLHATRSARDAIGARVTASFAGGEVTRQLMAGDGYMASNERVVEFGLGQVEKVEEITIRWPSGAISRLTSPPIDTAWIVAEGSELATGRLGSRTMSFPVHVEYEGK